MAYVPPHSRIITRNYIDQYIPHNIPDIPPNNLLDYIEIGENCGCGSAIVKNPIDIRRVSNNPGQKIGNNAKLFYCTNNDFRHYFIKTQMYHNGTFDRCVYKYDNFYMRTNIENNLTRREYIPILNTTNVPNNFYSNKSLKYFNTHTNTFEELRRYIPSSMKVPLILRDYLKSFRKYIGREASNNLYVIGVQYRTYPCDIQLGITETYKHGEANNNAKHRAKYEELQITNRKPNNNIKIARITNHKNANWFIRYLNENDYNHVNSSKNSKANNPRNKVGLLIIGRENDLRTMCENFNVKNINSMDDSIGRPIIIKLNHVLRETHRNKWFTNIDQPVAIERTQYYNGVILNNQEHITNISNHLYNKYRETRNNHNNNLYQTAAHTGSKSNRSASRSATHSPVNHH